MNALLTSRGPRFLPLLAMGIVLAGSTPQAHAEMLNSHLTDRATLTPGRPSAEGVTPRVVYESQGEKRSEMHDGEHSGSRVLAALTLTLIIPAGTMPTIADAPSPPPPPPPPPPLQTTSSPPSTTPGGGTISGGPPPAGTPEPGTLVLVLTGSGTAMLGWFRRRRTNSTSRTH